MKAWFMCCWYSTCLNSSGKHSRWWTPSSNKMPSRHQLRINVDCGHIIYNHTCVFLANDVLRKPCRKNNPHIPSRFKICVWNYVMCSLWRTWVDNFSAVRVGSAYPIRGVLKPMSEQCRLPSAKKTAQQNHWHLGFSFFSADAFVKKIDPNPAFRIIHQSNLPFWTLLLQHAWTGHLPSTTCKPAESANNHEFPDGFGWFHVHFRWLWGHFLAPDCLPVPCHMETAGSMIGYNAIASAASIAISFAVKS